MLEIILKLTLPSLVSDRSIEAFGNILVVAITNRNVEVVGHP